MRVLGVSRNFGAAVEVAERTGSGPFVSHRPPPHPIVISTRRANDGRAPKTTVDDMAVAPAWNARARSSFLIAQAMRPRGFVELSTLVIIALGVSVGLLSIAVLHSESVVKAQRAQRAEMIDELVLAHARVDGGEDGGVAGVGALRKCRAVLEARDEACSCWLPTGGAQ